MDKSAEVAVQNAGQGNYKISFQAHGSIEHHRPIATCFTRLCASLCPEIIETCRFSQSDSFPRIATIRLKEVVPSMGSQFRIIKLWEEQPEFKKTEIIAKSRRCIDEDDASEALISISDGRLILRSEGKQSICVTYQFKLDLADDAPSIAKRLPILIFRRMMLRLKEFMDKHSNQPYGADYGCHETNRLASLDLA